MADDWRIRIEVEEDGHAEGLLGRLGADLGGEARELARELEARRLAASRDGDTVFVYTSTQDEARKAEAVIHALLHDAGIDAKASRVEHWLADEERWDDEPPGETWEEEEIDRGYAPWEVRVACASRDAARDLADSLEREGYRPVRQFHYVIAGVASRHEADALAAKLHGSVEPGGELVWEASPGNPCAVFGGLGA